ncbi:hypothetical protein GobsT_16550 [Gemmata obscuriglobus]|uniref:Carboxypeptidase regulatory-like domain-containing protein n=1 Tax=Gemmata obscuriglobus TaxID=114 RepID=A0A2Z3HF53_9BACT|nr:carboxypeptidase-like regulatory domain-containing protein [Gemmata obscuriglobus]AWM39950.1 carboxypeptidase regulatory-like domain-containing protein [Gemmata obscuriglobus]QEG26907.1 hypothetical protein GobsT_16550 [Gemmata obscuriglobus]VTS03012.1 Uncharacterized protein OS=Singulisphaera acidiphila (strain ATCC BAA-1392 / DSM 18658 / VKM B-2454 / MOB10) GN=Sinac_3752 PE=4 SV=1 [Gemmata obscuriglobus UQM 2246]
MASSDRAPPAARLAGALALLTALGCGAGGPPPAQPTRGEVRLQGKPVAGAWVVLTATEGDKARAMKPFGRTGPDGTFRLRTYEGEDGAPAGEYAVTITWPGPPPKGDPDATEGPDRLKGRFADPAKARWKVQIAPGDNTLPAFVLD